MTTPATNLKGYNVLIRLSSEEGPQGSWSSKWALLQRTHVVHGAADPSYDGVWAGIASVSSFRQSLGSFAERNIVFPSITVELARGTGAEELDDEAVMLIRERDYLAGATVEFFLVSEEDPDPSWANRFHVGAIGRGDVEIDRNTVKIECRDRMEKEDKTIPPTRFSDEPPVDEGSFEQPVPILIGEWDREQSDYWVPAVCVDTAADSDDKPLRAQLCRPGSHGIGSFGIKARWVDSDGRYKRNETGYREHVIRVVDASGGFFEMAGTDYQTIGCRWESGDRIEVFRPKGDLDAQGNLISSPVDAIRHFLTDTLVGMNLPESALDLDSFAAVSELADVYGYRCRGRVAEETSALTVISEICHEFGLKLTVRNGRYALVHLGWSDAFAQPAMTMEAGQILDWREWNDRDRSGSSSLLLKYRQRPSDEVFTRTSAFSETTGAYAGTRQIECRWIFDDETALQRGSNWALMFGGVLRSLRLQSDFNGFGVRLGDFVTVTWPEGKGIFQVTDLNFTFDPPIRLEMDLLALNQPTQTGAWSSDFGEMVPERFGGGLMPEGWSDASGNQREGLSFWVDEAGKNPDGSPGRAWGR